MHIIIQLRRCKTCLLWIVSRPNRTCRRLLMLVAFPWSASFSGTMHVRDVPGENALSYSNHLDPDASRHSCCSAHCIAYPAYQTPLVPCVSCSCIYQATVSARPIACASCCCLHVSADIGHGILHGPSRPVSSIRSSVGSRSVKSSDTCTPKRSWCLHGQLSLMVCLIREYATPWSSCGVRRTSVCREQPTPWRRMYVRRARRRVSRRANSLLRSSDTGLRRAHTHTARPFCIWRSVWRQRTMMQNMCVCGTRNSGVALGAMPSFPLLQNRCAVLTRNKIAARRRRFFVHLPCRHLKQTCTMHGHFSMP